VLDASDYLMPSRIIDDGGDGRSGRDRSARDGGDPLCERRYNLFEFRLLDQRSRLARLNPLDQPLFELRPSLALSFHKQREDFDLATHLDTVLDSVPAYPRSIRARCLLPGTKAGGVAMEDGMRLSRRRTAEAGLACGFARAGDGAPDGFLGQRRNI
jgi:hypothetical protein